MVKHGQFSLGLVRAETGASYNEHGAPGDSKDIYAEVEPEDEFYLRLRSDAPEVVYVDLRVDGAVIQKGHRLRPGEASKVGVIRADSSSGETSTTEVALRFARAKVHDESKKEGACEYWTGQVEARFWGNPSYRIPPEASPKPEGPMNPEDDKSAAPVVAAPMNGVTYSAPKCTYFLNPSLASSDVGFVPVKTNDSQKKGVKSAEGMTALRTHNLNWKPRKPIDLDEKSTSSAVNRALWAPKVKKPEILGTVTLRYCSTVGLIHAGILDKPPNWEVERLKLTCSKRTREDHARILKDLKIQKFELTSERINGRGEKVVEKTQVEVLDLTESS